LVKLCLLLQIREALLKKKEKLVALLRSLCARVPRKMMTVVSAKFLDIERVRALMLMRNTDCLHGACPMHMCATLLNIELVCMLFLGMFYSRKHVVPWKSVFIFTYKTAYKDVACCRCCTRNQRSLRMCSSCASSSTLDIHNDTHMV
jgi:hypothetical protein